MSDFSQTERILILLTSHELTSHHWRLFDMPKNLIAFKHDRKMLVTIIQYAKIYNRVKSNFLTVLLTNVYEKNDLENLYLDIQNAK